MIEVPDYADLLHKPFELWARGPERYSCMGLVREVYRRAGIHTVDPLDDLDGAEEQWEIVDLPGPWLPMDVLLMAKPDRELGGHVGIYLGDSDRILHAAEGRGVIVSKISQLVLEVRFAYRWKRGSEAR